MKVTIDTKDFKQYRKILNDLGRSDFPLAVRGTLNDMAFDAKQRTLPRMYDKRFVVRQKNFLKSHSGAKRCENTFDINKMQSEVGIYNKPNETIGDRVAVQEEGGVFQNRATPVYKGQNSPTRISRSSSKKQRADMIYRRFKNKTKPGAYIMSVKENGVILRTKKGSIIHMSKDVKFKDGKLVQGKTSLLYTPKGTVREKKRPFMLPAAKKTNREKADEYFKENVLKRIAKHKNKI